MHLTFPQPYYQERSQAEWKRSSKGWKDFSSVKDLCLGRKRSHGTNQLTSMRNLPFTNISLTQFLVRKRILPFLTSHKKWGQRKKKVAHRFLAERGRREMGWADVQISFHPYSKTRSPSHRHSWDSCLIDLIWDRKAFSQIEVFLSKMRQEGGEICIFRISLRTSQNVLLLWKARESFQKAPLSESYAITMNILSHSVVFQKLGFCTTRGFVPGWTSIFSAL